jgi:hypothetical protein
VPPCPSCAACHNESVASTLAVITTGSPHLTQPLTNATRGGNRRIATSPWLGHWKHHVTSGLRDMAFARSSPHNPSFRAAPPAYCAAVCTRRTDVSGQVCPASCMPRALTRSNRKSSQWTDHRTMHAQPRPDSRAGSCRLVGKSAALPA